MRFIIPADICGACAPFGGIAAQLNHLSIALQIATTDAIGTDLAYDQISQAHQEELARSRAAGKSGAADSSGFLLNGNQSFKTQAISQHANPRQ